MRTFSIVVAAVTFASLSRGLAQSSPAAGDRTSVSVKGEAASRTASAATASDAGKSSDDLTAEAALATPGAEHKRLTDLAGNWNVSAHWPLEPDQVPKVFEGTATIRPILGGRFIELDAKSVGPAAVESLTILGFDRRAKVYTWVSFDTMGTYYVTASGPWDERARTMVMTGSDGDPVMKVVTSYRVRLHPVDADELRMTLDVVHPDGSESLVVDSTYTRRK